MKDCKYILMIKGIGSIVKMFTIVAILLLACCGSFAQATLADKKDISTLAEPDTAIIADYIKESRKLAQSDPSAALLLAVKALNASEKISYAIGKQKALGDIANRYTSMGNFAKALESNLLLLKLVENEKDKKSIVSVLTNIGLVYASQEQFHSALIYYYKADSMISRYNLHSNAANISLNIGDSYDKMNNTDSAYIYFNRCLAIAEKDKSDLYRGAALVGMGHTYMKMKALQAAKNSYLRGLYFLKKINYNELVCEASLGLSTLYSKIGSKDSAIYYAKNAHNLAIVNEFFPWQLNAAKALSALYNSTGNSDSSLRYLQESVKINDSINSRERILSMEGMTSSETIRQAEIAEKKAKEKKERKQSLQLLFIAIFIPGFFVVTLFMSKVQLPLKVIRWLGVLSLIILVEFITLLMHPFVAELTHHTPILEMLIFVSMALIIIPGHHKLEKWLLKWLVKNRTPEQGDKIKITTKKLDNY